jgi:hypothetical protein
VSGNQTPPAPNSGADASDKTRVVLAPAAECGATRPSLGFTLIAPVVLLGAPSRLGRVLRDAGTAAIVLLGLLLPTIFASCLMALKVWSQTVRLEWTGVLVPPTTLPATAPAPVLPTPQFEVRRRTMAQVWSDAHGGRMVSEFEIVGVAAFLGALGALAAYAWLQLPRAHGCGSVLRTYGRCVRGALALGLPVTLIALFYGWVIINHNHRNLVMNVPGYPATAFVLLVVDSELTPAIAGLVIIVVLTWAGRVIRAAATDDSVLELPDRCEGCGYDLTMQPLEGRCPECARPIASSIGATAARQGVGWEARRSPAGFFAAVRSVILRPTEFYRRLRVRTNCNAAERFALLAYALAGAGAVIWLFTIHAIEFGLEYTIDRVSRMRDDVVGLFAGALTIGPLVLYAGHRLGAAVVTTWWLLRGFVPDTRWTWKVICYEAAWLWVYCFFWGAVITTFMFRPRWPIELCYALGMPQPWPSGFMAVVLVLAGTAGLSFIWILRYERAGRAVRWANY